MRWRRVARLKRRSDRQQRFSSDANVDYDLSSYKASYHWFLFELADVRPSSDNVNFYLELSDDSGVSFDVQYWAAPYMGNAGGDKGLDGLIWFTLPINSPRHHGSAGRYLIYDSFNDQNYAQLSYVQTLVHGVKSGYGWAGDYDYARLTYSSGNLASGTAKLYGLINPPFGTMQMLDTSQIPDA